MELITPHQEIKNTKRRITIDLIKDGEEFLGNYDINQELVLDTISIVYKYLKINGKIPHNLYKFFIAAYYILSHHPLAFPAHESKKEFCNKFGIQQSSLEYSVEKLVMTLNYRVIFDDMNFPYYLDPKSDLGFRVAKNLVKTTVEQSMISFLLGNQQFNSQFLCEELVNKLIFEMNLFPEELLRPIYELISEFVDECLQDQHYNEYVQLQNKYFI